MARKVLFIIVLFALTIQQYSLVQSLPPIVIVPGIGGSQIQASLNRETSAHWWCDRKYGWYTLWLSIEELLAPPLVECWTDDIKCVYNQTTNRMENTPGVHVKIPAFGNTSSIEYLDPSLSHPGEYFAPFIQNIVDKFRYERGVNIRAAPYDFRYGPEYAIEYFAKLKELIEATYMINKKKRVLLVSQSMGCTYTLIFLRNQTQAWIDKYLATWMTISGPWGGAVKSLRAYISGDPFGVPPLLDSPILMRPAQRTYSSLAFISPSKEFWAPEEVLVQTAVRNYTVKDYDALFKDIGFELGSTIMRQSIPGWNAIPPALPIYCYHGTEHRTPGVLYYGRGDFPDEQPYVKHDNGDGTVNIRSLRGCLRWKTKPKYPMNHREYPGAEHNGILSDARLISDVFDVINKLIDDQSLIDNETHK